MATPRRSQWLYDDLLSRHGRVVADAFFKAMDDLRSAVQIGRVVSALEAGNIEAAIEALHLDPVVYNELLDKIREAYTEGGVRAVEVMPKRLPTGAALTIRFDGRNLAAEQWLATRSSTLIERITDDQRNAVRTSLTEAMAKGQNPRAAALDIVGRINRVTGKREGGILGLSEAQEAYVRTARDQLASSDPAELRAYLKRTRRDKRFDRSVTKAIREGGKVPPEIAANAATAYERRLLQLRGETIGRVEAMTSLQQGKFDAYRQAVDSGKIEAGAVTKVWRSAGDNRVRHTHRDLNAESVGMNDVFVSPSGAMMLHPMDTSMGAGPEEIIGCRCDCEYRIDFLANLR